MFSCKNMLTALLIIVVVLIGHGLGSCTVRGRGRPDLLLSTIQELPFTPTSMQAPGGSTPTWTPTLASTKTPTRTLTPSPQPSAAATATISAYHALPFGQYVVYSDASKDEGMFLLSLDGQLNEKLTDLYGRSISSNGRVILGSTLDQLDSERIYFFEDGSSMPFDEKKGCSAFAPDLQQIVSGCWEDGHLYLSALNGTERTRLTTITSLDEYFAYPSWSPDGKWIAFFNLTHGENMQLGEDPDDGLMILDTACFEIPETCPASIQGPYKGNVFFMETVWKPDSSTMAVFPSQRTRVIQLFNLKTRQFAPLYGAECAKGFDLTSAAWSPDGNWFAYNCVNFDNQSASIMLIPSNGGEPIELIESPNVNLHYWISIPFQLGRQYMVTKAGTKLNLRATPSLEGDVLHQLQAGDEIIVLEGPIHEGEYDWWKVKCIDDGFSGWVVENPGWYRELMIDGDGRPAQQPPP